MPRRYDLALPAMIAVLLDLVGKEFLLKNLIFRDADGLLSFVLREPIDEAFFDELSRALTEVLEGYAGRPVLMSRDSLCDNSLMDPNKDDLELVSCIGHDPFYIRFQEKRIVGNDWSRGMQKPLEGVPPIVVFSSLKGGVGRSTALAVTAKTLSSEGLNVLAIDLDLEAPGIGGMLMSQDCHPEYGSLDYYVEFGRTPIDLEFLRGMCFDVPSSAGGCITIVPAVGRSASQYPENVLGKISRAYLESADDTGSVFTFSDKTRKLIADLLKICDCDVIFIDARAGLNESTAATIQGLGADVLFFGIDTPQTWEGYRYFFSHMARYKNRTSEEDDWRFRLKMVHSKSNESENARGAFRDSAFELFASFLYDELEGNETAEGLPRAFGFDLDDVTAPHYALVIPISQDYHEFNPLIDDFQYEPERVVPVFGEFINGLKQLVRLE